MLLRLLQTKDWAIVLVALEKLKHFASRYEWVGEVDWEKGTQVIYDAIVNGNAYYISGYLVLVDTVEPWYTRDRLLQEWLVIKLDSNGVISDVPKGLLSIAYLRGCKAVITADSSPVQFVAKAYQEAGYKPLTNSFFKVVPTWDSSDKPQLSSQEQTFKQTP